MFPFPPTRPRSPWRAIGLALTAAGLMWPQPGRTQEDQPPVEKAQPAAAAKYLTLNSPMTDETIGWVRRTALELQDTAVREKRPVYLLLELTPGTSQFHHVYALADFLTSSAVSNVTTVAWVPETVTGNNAVVALACKEVVMHPDAQLGDIGRGEALPPEQQTIVRAMVAKRRNVKVNQALATAMMDPATTLVQLTVEPREGVAEKRLVTEDEAAKLREADVVVRDRTVIKEAGTAGIFSGTTARNGDFLVMQTVDTRRDLADAYGLPLETLREQRSPGKSSQVSIIEVKDTIDPLLESFLKRQIQRAVADGAKIIIFEIESPGGYLWQSRDLAFTIAELETRDIRTIAFVPKQALSGAAIIALGCDEIYLTPGGVIGDAGPIEMREGGQFERADEKVLSFLRETLKTLARRKGRPTAVAMAMADRNLLVYEVFHKTKGTVWYMSEDELHAAGDEWTKGRLVPESKEHLLLTVSGERAHELKIAEPPVAGFDELKDRLGIPLDLQPQRVGRTWVDTVVFVLNSGIGSFFIITLGIICLYVELHLPSGLFGILSALCFALFFWSKFLGGTAGWLEVVLFLLGLACLAIEIFVIPGFGVVGVSGVLLMIAALVMASQTFGSLEPSRDMNALRETLTTFGASIAAVVVMAAAISRFLPKIPFLNEMILVPPGMHDVAAPDAPRLRPELAGPLGTLRGMEGTTATVLRPAGKAMIGGKLVDVVSDGPFIPADSPVVVVETAGNRIVVRQA